MRPRTRAYLRWNDELLLQVRSENVFFSVRPIVLSLALATMFNSTTLSSSRLNVHRRGLLVAPNRPVQSVWLPRRHQRCAVGRGWRVLASAQRRTLPRQAAGAFGDVAKLVFSAAAICCRSMLHRPPPHPPSGSVPSHLFAMLPYITTRYARSVRCASRHISLRRSHWRPRIGSVRTLRCHRVRRFLLTVNDEGYEASSLAKPTVSAQQMPWASFSTARS